MADAKPAGTPVPDLRSRLRASISSITSLQRSPLFDDASEGAGVVAKLGDARVTVAAGHAVAGQPYYNVRCAAPQKTEVQVAHAMLPFRELRQSMRSGGFDELVRSPFPELLRARSLSSLIGASKPVASEEEPAVQLERWLCEVVQLAQWGCLSNRLVVQIAQLIQHDSMTDVVVVVSPAVHEPGRASSRHNGYDGDAATKMRRRAQSLRPVALMEQAVSPDEAPPAVRQSAAAFAAAAAETSAAPVGPRLADGAKAHRIAELESLVRALRSKLSSQAADGAEDKTLDELEGDLKRAAEKLFSGDTTVEAELENIDRAIRAHPDFVERIAQQSADWEREQLPLNLAALERTRRLVPRDINSSTSRRVHAAFSAAAASRGVSDARRLRGYSNAAKRVWSTPALWLVRLEPARVRKLHPADLRSRFAVNSLDVVELRAVYAVLPFDFDADSDGAKKAWREQARSKLQELVERERQGTLNKAQQRHASYVEFCADDMDIDAFVADADAPAEPPSPPSPQSPLPQPPLPSTLPSPDSAAIGKRPEGLARRASTGTSFLEATERRRATPATPDDAVEAVRPPPPDLLMQLQRRSLQQARKV
ncbi:hypothetical protein M885DRAFT_543109 [Pelagophyceae sp. CCMP2097]|nr:hypothetical protein M885DRAFT_543109 [Pelagophyceae sp. CCMP2097]